jgi:hypothetical protein
MTEREPFSYAPGELLTKIEAARRQLRSAIRLFLEEGDDVSIYTLACAAQEVLRGLLKPRGVEEASFIKDTDWVKPEFYRKYLTLINAPQNFFKHADRDPADSIEFQAELLPFVLHDCIRMYAKLTDRMLREGAAFVGWFLVAYPDLLKPGAFAEAVKYVTGEAVAASVYIKRRQPYRMLLDRHDTFPGTD